MKNHIFNFIKINIIIFCLTQNTILNIDLLIPSSILISFIHPLLSILTIPIIYYFNDIFLTILLSIIYFINFSIKNKHKNIYTLNILYAFLLLCSFILINNITIYTYIICMLYIFTCVFSLDTQNQIYIKNKSLLYLIISLTCLINIALNNSIYLIPIIITYIFFNLTKYKFILFSILVITISYITLDIKYSYLLIIYLLVLLNNLYVINIIFLLLLTIYFQRDIIYILPNIIIYLHYSINKKEEIFPSVLENNNKQFIKIAKKYLYNTTNVNLNIDTKMNYLQNNYCKNCTRRNICYQKRVDIYNYLYLCITSKKDLTLLNIPINLKSIVSNCVYYNDIFKIEKTDSSAIKQNALIDQLDILLQNNTFLTHQNEKLNNIPNELKKLGHIIKNYTYQYSDNILKIQFNKQSYVNNMVLVKQTSNYLKTPLNIFQQDETITLTSKPKVKILSDYSFIAKNNYLLSGDNYLSKNKYNINHYFALSDGMGSGYNAFCQSKETIDLINSMLDLDYSFEKTIALLNSLHNIKDNSENYSTLDLLKIDCINLEAQLYKFGSTYSYLINNNQIKTFNNTCLPLGISKNYNHYKFNIKKGNIIILISDGISDNYKDNEFYNLLSTLIFKKPSDIVNEIINQTIKKTKNNINDDISVMAIKII